MAVREMLNSEAKSLAPIRRNGKPNLDELTVALRDINSLKLTVKYFGYELARSLAAALPPVPRGEPRTVGLQSKASTQADIESEWAAHWFAELCIPLMYHRKLWEFAYVLQAIHDHGSLRPGARGLGFGCGTEVLPSYLASKGVDVTMTDLAPEDVQGMGWADTNEHASSRDVAFHSHLVTRELFDRHVELKYVDMNAIDPALRGYDFCWSICAFEHLGSIAQGMAFVENSMATLRPGGLSIHTTEFNFADDTQTIDNWITVLFQRRHFIALAEQLTRAGHTVAPLNFDVGGLPLDKFIDVPPYIGDLPGTLADSWGTYGPHIKLTIDGIASTCFGLAIVKGG